MTTDWTREEYQRIQQIYMEHNLEIFQKSLNSTWKYTNDKVDINLHVRSPTVLVMFLILFI